MTDNKPDVPCPTRTLAVRSDGTIVRGLAATRTDARRWLEAVQTHGRRTALAQVALAARGRRLFAEPACSGSLAMSD